MAEIDKALPNVKQIHKKKGTKPKDVSPDEGYDLDAYFDPESGTYYD